MSAYDSNTWGSLFPATIGNEARPTDAVDNSLAFAADKFPQFMSSDPVKYTLQNAFLKQLFSNDMRLYEEANTIKEDYLPLAGGTMTGAITLPADPTANLQAATKQYVDSLTKKATAANMTGATSTADGIGGLVPQPTKGQQNQVLTGAGVFRTILSLLTAFGGATATVAGSLGGVPAPTAGQQADLLTGAGAWAALADILAPLGLQNGAVYAAGGNSSAWYIKLNGAAKLLICGGTVSVPGIGGGSSVYAMPFSTLWTRSATAVPSQANLGIGSGAYIIQDASDNTKIAIDVSNADWIGNAEYIAFGLWG